MKFKKFLLLLFAVLTNTKVFADYSPYINGLNYIFDSENGTATVTYRYYSGSDYYSDRSGDVIIPETVNYNGQTYRVTCIGDHAFCNSSDLTSISVPSSIKRIGVGAFKNCTSLSKVIVTDIAAWCGIIYEGTDFNCDFPLGRALHLYSDEFTEITTVNIPEGVTRIEPLAFRDAKYITSVTIPNSVTYIGREAFRGMHRLTSINIPQTITSIEPFTFNDCQALPNISIPEGITSIGNDAFSDCFRLASITLPQNVAIIGNYAFFNCRSLLSIHIPKYVSTIGENTFAGCSSLSDVTLNDNLTEIGQRAFQNTNIKNLVIPNSVQKIGPWAFENYNNNPSLKSLVLGESLVSILSGAFLSQTNLKKVTCLAINPPAIQDQYIFSVYDTLYVPSGREVAYEVANYWQDFKYIKGLDRAVDKETDLLSNKWSGARYTVQAISYTGGLYGDSETVSNANYNRIADAPKTDANGRNWFETNYTCNWQERTAPLNNWCPYNYIGDIYARRKFYYDGALPTGLYLACGHDDAPCEYYLNGELIWSVTDGWFEQEIYKLTPDQVALLKPGEQNVLAFHVHQNWGGMYADCGLYTSLSNIGISNKCGDNLTWSFDEETGTLTISGTGDMYDNTLWAGFHSQIKHVIIQSGVTSIGIRAFDNCQSMKSIDIPESVTSIGEFAFYNCTRLSSIDIPSGVKSISDFAFEGCRSLTSINIPYGVKNIGISSFGRCSSLTSITIPISITSIGDYAFEYDMCLSDVFCYAEEVPQTKSSAFNSSNIAASTLHVPVESVSAYEAAEPWNQFGNIEAIVESEEGIVVTVDADGNADGGHQFTKIDDSNFIIDGIKYKVENGNLEVSGYDDATFAGVASIISRLKYNGQILDVVSIGGEAFRDCSSLTSITIPEGVTSIGNNAFYYCVSLPSITIPNSVTSIGNGAFCDCTSLADVTIPESVASIGYEAFSYCPNLTSIKVETGNPTYDSRNNCNAIIETATNTLIVGCLSTIIPNSVTSIGDNAFFGCHNLTSIAIPNSVTSIGMQAFRDCTSLIDVTIPNSVTRIGDLAFYNCSSLTSIIIPASVTSIGEWAFRDCSSLTTVKMGSASPVVIETNTFSNRTNATLYVPYGSKTAYEAADYWNEFKEIKEMETESAIIAFVDSNVKAICVANWDTNGDGELSYEEAAAVTSLGSVFKGNTSIKTFNEMQFFTGLTTIGDNAFYNCTGLTDITLPADVISIGNNAFYKCSGLTSVTIPSNVTRIGSYAFYHCASLTSITIPRGVTNISEYTFAKCNSLISIIIPNSVTNIGNQAFKSCTNLSTITIPNSITSIGYETFGYCTSLEAITIPNSVTSIGQQAFHNCTNLSSVTIGYGVTNIERETFSRCSSLTSITIPNSVTSIGIDAFANCSALTSIIIPENVTSISPFTFSGCSSLTSITIPNKVTTIDIYAFQDCSNLSSIIIPASVTKIGSGAFSGCSNLTYVKVENATPVYISDNITFSNRGNSVLCVPVGSKMSYASASYWGSFHKIIEFHEGDVNVDEGVNVLDVVDIARFVIGTPASTFVEILADINKDNTVNLGDAVVLVNEIAGDQNFAKAWSSPSRVTANDILSLRQHNSSLSMNLENERNYTAFQFDLYVPEDVDVTQMMLNAERKQGHQLLYNKVEEGHYRVAALSTSNNEFKGHDGELLSIALNELSGDEVSIRNIHFFDAMGNDYLFEDVESAITTSLTLTLSKGKGDIYDLQGRKRKKLQKGVNIVNGKKILF